jgi:hypothetical protein
LPFSTFVLSPAPDTKDFNLDGHPDLVWQNDSTRQAAVWYLGGPQGNTFLGGNYLGSMGAAGVPGWRVVASGDFNADGHPDLVWLSDSMRQAAVWYMGGPEGNVFLGGNWLSDLGAAGVPGWTVVGAADFNADGHPDLVWQNDMTRQLAVWYMGGAQGTTFLGGNWLGDAGAAGVPGWKVVATADFNSDGHPDVVWQNDSTRQVAVWYMGGANGNTFLGGNWLGDAGAAGVPGWTVVGASDFNNDGHPDVAWQNDTSRQAAVWYMTGTEGNVFQGGNWLSETGVAGWKVIVR